MLTDFWIGFGSGLLAATLPGLGVLALRVHRARERRLLAWRLRG